MICTCYYDIHFRSVNDMISEGDAEISLHTKSLSSRGLGGVFTVISDPLSLRIVNWGAGMRGGDSLTQKTYSVYFDNIFPPIGQV